MITYFLNTPRVIMGCQESGKNLINRNNQGKYIFIQTYIWSVVDAVQIDIYLCGTLSPIIASQKGLSFSFYSVFAAYLHRRKQNINYKDKGVYDVFQESFDSRHACVIVLIEMDKATHEQPVT